MKAADTDEDVTDAENVTDPNAGASLPQDTGKTTEALDSKLEALPPRSPIIMISHSNGGRRNLFQF